MLGNGKAGLTGGQGAAQTPGMGMSSGKGGLKPGQAPGSGMSNGKGASASAAQPAPRNPALPPLPAPAAGAAGGADPVFGSLAAMFGQQAAMGSGVPRQTSFEGGGGQGVTVPTITAPVRQPVAPPAPVTPRPAAPAQARPTGPLATTNSVAGRMMLQEMNRNHAGGVNPAELDVWRRFNPQYSKKA